MHLRSVVYNIELNADKMDDVNKYVRAFDVFAKEFPFFTSTFYDGACRIQFTVGNYLLEPPDMVRKQLVPRLHIIASGKGAKNIDSLLEEFIGVHFDVREYNKFYMDDNPFSRHNEELFSTIAFRRMRMAINRENMPVKKLKRIFAASRRENTIKNDFRS